MMIETMMTITKCHSWNHTQTERGGDEHFRDRTPRDVEQIAALEWS